MKQSQLDVILKWSLKNYKNRQKYTSHFYIFFFMIWDAKTTIEIIKDELKKLKKSGTTYVLNRGMFLFVFDLSQIQQASKHFYLTFLSLVLVFGCQPTSYVTPYFLTNVLVLFKTVCFVFAFVIHAASNPAKTTFNTVYSPPTNLRISLNPQTTAQVGIAAWYPKNGKNFSALRAGSDNSAGWNSSRKTGGEYPVSSPPPKNGLFGGGMIFFGIFSWIFGFGTQKKFWKNFEAKPMFWNNYRPIPTTSGHFVIWGNSKNQGFSAFLGKFGNFFFQNTILDQIGPRIIKNDFSDIL